jgi:hypothetical protein
MSESQQSSRGNEISRRDFARRAALTAATVAVVPAEVFAESKKAATPAKPVAKTPEPAAGEPAKELSAASQAEVENAYKNILDRYGARLSAEQKKDIRRLLAQQQKGIDAIRAFPLDNADEPATVLHVVTTSPPPAAGVAPQKG